VSISSILGNKLSESTDEREEERPYREAIGALTYLMMATRPDIANTVSRLAQFTVNQKKSIGLPSRKSSGTWRNQNTLDLVKYVKTGVSVHGYSDSDWENCRIDRKSYTGYCFILGGAAIAWKA